DITDLNTANAKIGILENSTALINNLLAGNITADMTQTIHLTGKNVVIDEGIIKNAMVESLDVEKINAGIISTDKFQIKSNTGGIEIVGETQQWRDENGRVRMIAGRDLNNKFTFGVFDETGQGTLIDSTGVKEKALADGIIKNRMINNNEISGKKINIDSLITEVNSNNTNSIKSTKVLLSDEGQTLDIGFKNVNSSISKLQENTTALQTEVSVHQGKIEGLIKETKIDSNGATVNLKDDYISLKATVTGINSSVSSVKSSLSSLNSRVTSNTTNISQLNNKIALKVESSDVINAIKQINFNSPNYIKNGCFLNGYDNWDETLEEDSTKSIVDSTSGYKKAFKIVTNANNQNIVQDTEVLPANTVYTASTYCYIEKGVASLVISIRNSSGKTETYEVKSSGLGWQWLELTFTTKSTNSVGLYLGNYFNGSSSFGTYYFTAVSIVKGKYRNDWQESSTYVNTSLANLNIEKNKIVTRVSNVETKSTNLNNTVSSLSTRVSTAEQAITPSSIVAKVTSGITGGKPLSTTAWKLEKNNFNVYNGAFNLYNSKNIKVFWVDTTGNTSLRGSIFNYDSNNVLRASLTDKKLHIYNESGSYIGGLGSNSYVNNSSIKGLTLDLDMAGKYISFAVKKSSSSNTYNTVFAYHRAGSFDSEGLNGYANFNMHGYNITNSGNLVESNYIKAMNWVSNDGGGGTNYIQVIVNRTSNQFARGITTWASDERLKFNIKDTKVNALTEISKFKHRQFNWLENGKHQDIGYIAQELERINPDYVFKVKQANGDFIYQIRPEMIIPVLSKAIQELKEENNILKERIDKISREF
ncbi:Chaperone of endosialidase, partial [Clostridium sp. DSM 8431]|uniref:tail fiber domain-containing protein n=1 Tax=Clostridium sp. DSM 8431 TaxID=1761781 RepID=UPI0008E9FA7A